MKQIIVLVGLLYILIPAHSQTRNRTQLSGQILDAKTGAPLPGASIQLAESKVGTIADSVGYYRLNTVPIGHTLIEVSYAGYKSIVEHLDIVAGTNTRDFLLTSSVVENAAVTVTPVGSATSIRKTPISVTRVNKTELL